MISRSFERPDRTVSRASDARNRYKIRYTRTQHRPASRQVNDHGRVSGTHRFTDLYQTGDLPEYHKIVNTLLAHMPQILAWHAAGRPSNGRIEGTNILLQVLRRTAHGFTNPHNFAARALLVT